MLDARQLFYRTYSRLPDRLQGLVFESYRAYIERVPFGPSPKREFVAEFFDSAAEFEEYVAEYHRREIGEEIAAARAEHRRRTGHGRFAAINQFTPERYYALVRAHRPEVLVETGVCNGVSTLVVLRALEANGTGHLHSVDLPDEDRLPAGVDPGWIVPDALRDRWSLTLGRSQERLPDVLAELDAVDLFLHDSLAIILDDEFDLVWPSLGAGDVMLVDDIYASDAFGHIATRGDVVAGNVAPNVGYAVKQEA